VHLVCFIIRISCTPTDLLLVFVIHATNPSYFKLLDQITKMSLHLLKSMSSEDAHYSVFSILQLLPFSLVYTFTSVLSPHPQLTFLSYSDRPGFTPTQAHPANRI